MIKAYVQFLAALFLSILFFGFIGPYMVSSKNTALVFIGVLLIVLAPVVIFLLLKTAYKNLKGIKDEKK